MAYSEFEYTVCYRALGEVSRFRRGLERRCIDPETKSIMLHVDPEVCKMLNGLYIITFNVSISH